ARPRLRPALLAPEGARDEGRPRRPLRRHRRRHRQVTRDLPRVPQAGPPRPRPGQPPPPPLAPPILQARRVRLPPRPELTLALGQVASQTRGEPPWRPRRMWVYVEGCQRARNVAVRAE